MRMISTADKRSRFRPLIPLLLATLGVSSPAGAGVRVDLNPDNGRSDVRSPEWENWPVRDGVASDSRTFGGVTVTLRKAGKAGNGITANWWKAGLDYPARMASDGVFVKGG